MLQVNDLVEVIGGHDSRKGTEGIVIFVDLDRVTVQPIDTNTWTYNGDPFPINAGLLLVLPTPTDFNRERTRLRAEHIANLTNPKGERPGNPRQYRTRPARKPPPS